MDVRGPGEAQETVPTATLPNRRAFPYLERNSALWSHPPFATSPLRQIPYSRVRSWLGE